MVWSAARRIGRRIPESPIARNSRRAILLKLSNYRAVSAGRRDRSAEDNFLEPCDPPLGEIAAQLSEWLRYASVSLWIHWIGGLVNVPDTASGRISSNRRKPAEDRDRWMVERNQPAYLFSGTSQWICMRMVFSSRRGAYCFSRIPNHIENLGYSSWKRASMS